MFTSCQTRKVVEALSFSQAVSNTNPQPRSVPNRPHGGRFGSVRSRKAIFKRWARTNVTASNIAIIRVGARYGTKSRTAKRSPSAAPFPRLRKQVGYDLALPGLPRQKVLAILVCLLEITLMRVGNQKYARDNDSFGLTTLRARHLDIAGSNMRFRFRGKSGIEHTITVTDRRIARISRRIVGLPGQELFQYSTKRASGGPSNPRTLTSTCAIAAVARVLGNTKTVCRKSYVHPGIIKAYLEGTLGTAMDKSKPTKGEMAVS